MDNTFKIQIPTSAIRNPEISHEAFYVLCKLIQRYYVLQDKNTKLTFDHKKFMYFSNIQSNQTFKKCINQLYENGWIRNKIEKLPRHDDIEIELNGILVGKDKEYYFAALEYYFMDQCVLDEIGYEGIRLMYYFKSWINEPNQFCFCSRETIAEHIGSSPNTVDKYVEKLRKLKLIKVERNMIQDTGEYEKDEFGTEKRKFTKYPNHYYLRFDKFKTVHTKLKQNTQH